MEMITVKEKILFSHEKNGFYELDNCALSRIVNEVGKDIIIDINEGLKLGDIAKKYCKGDFSRNDLFLFLSDLKKLKYIDFEDSYFADLFDADLVKIAGEKEYVRICQYIQNNGERLIYPEIFKKTAYNVMTVRTKSFSNFETVLYEEVGDKIGAVISVKGFNTVNSPVVISYMMLGNDGMNSLVSFYGEVEKFCIKEKKHKIKILFETRNIPKQVNIFMERVGFSFEAELKCEDGEKDTIIYSRLLRV